MQSIYFMHADIVIFSTTTLTANHNIRLFQTVTRAVRSFCVVTCARRDLSLTKFRSSSKMKQLTSHAIVGEPLTELIHHNEEDAYWVAQHSLLLQGEQI